MIEDIDTARRAGAHLHSACEVVGISLRTYRRWTGAARCGPMDDPRRCTRRRCSA